MAGRAGVPPDEYAKFLPGTRFLTPEEALARFEKKDGLESLYGSGMVADEFNVANKVYAKPQPVAEYLDGSLLREALGAPQAARRDNRGAMAARPARLAPPVRRAAAATADDARRAGVPAADRRSGAWSATCRSSGTR